MKLDETGLTAEEKARVRKTADIIVSKMDTKIHAGEWVRIETVRRALHEIIAHYEREVHILNRTINGYRVQRRAELEGEEE